jgi:hypothetical protein
MPLGAKTRQTMDSSDYVRNAERDAKLIAALNAVM